MGYYAATKGVGYKPEISMIPEAGVFRETEGSIAHHR
jgi:hypothetical protein